MFEDRFGRRFDDDDNIGFDPTFNQSEYGTPRHSPYGVEARGMESHGILDYFPTYPYRGRVDYTGAQMYANNPPDSIFARTHGYRGVAPLGLQPIIDRGLPYERGEYE